ncbi:Polyadenylate-binding protein 7 [Nymphaea thermarum]|nr:Polyadenylate-binding protein 7 [Nymphaea thermarum]
MASDAVLAPASLYVGDLHPDATDKDLFDLFKLVKVPVSVRVCVDSLTGHSLGYGYVNYINHADALRAMHTLNNSQLKGKSIRIMWTEKDPTARKSGVANLFVKNLHRSIDNVTLPRLFEKYGNILSSKVATDQLGKSKGYGFVQFDSEDSANNAIENLNNTVIRGMQLFVGPFIKKTERNIVSPDAKYTNLYIKNLDAQVTEEVLKEKFSEFGKITNVIIMRGDDGISKGFGFVNFDDHEDAKRALEGMNGKFVGTQALYVARAQKKAEREEILHRQYEERRNEKVLKYQGSNVYVKNIDDAVDDGELQEYFSKFGTITSVKLMRDDKGISKGFGFVCFSSPDEANKAVATCHGNMYHGKPLYVAIAQKKEIRQAQLQLQYAQRVGEIAGSVRPVFPAGYSPLNYYAPPPPGAVPPVPPRQTLVYQPLGLRPGWRPDAFPPRPPLTRPAFRPIPMSLQRKHVQNGPVHDVNVRPADHTVAPNAVGTTAPEMGVLTSLLAAVSPQEQKQILGNRLFPLIEKLQFGLAGKITGMLLEMDNAELLLFLESPEALAAKVDEAVQVLNLSKAKVESQDVLHSKFLSAEVAVN